jgi:hypothetical protein
MSAETKIYVEVLVSHREWRTVSAVTLDEAVESARRQGGVIDVLRASYDEPVEEGDPT